MLKFTAAVESIMTPFGVITTLKKVSADLLLLVQGEGNVRFKFSRNLADMREILCTSHDDGALVVTAAIEIIPTPSGFSTMLAEGSNGLFSLWNSAGGGGYLNFHFIWSPLGSLMVLI